ncbi:outer membrane beta-barrel protein [Helicobacter trogontum]|uniref:outer membrane beta-barrel protein n=1 Tax=Helicobacter trogontum TaxID=50960 RepID=UPI000CF0E079|nr:outer membrane beta-barrel protein [Helicobacter trogontum]
MKLVKKSVVTTKVTTNTSMISTSMISKGIVGTFLALGLFSSTLSAKSGLFVGIDLGASILTQDYRNEISSQNTITTMKYSYLMPQVGFRLGYQHYFTHTNGLRLYGSYAVARTGMVHVEGNTRNSEANRITDQYFYATKRLEANLDYLLDLVKTENSSAGVYLGVFYGAPTITLNRKNAKPYQFSGDLKQEIVGINLGLQMTLASHHRIEVGAKIPLNRQKVERIDVANGLQHAPQNNSTIKTLYAYQLASVGLSYAFVF